MDFTFTREQEKLREEVRENMGVKSSVDLPNELPRHK